MEFLRQEAHLLKEDLKMTRMVVSFELLIFVLFFFHKSRRLSLKNNL